MYDDVILWKDECVATTGYMTSWIDRLVVCESVTELSCVRSVRLCTRLAGAGTGYPAAGGCHVVPKADGVSVSV